jgi:DNA modification methylase
VGAGVKRVGCKLWIKERWNYGIMEHTGVGYSELGEYLLHDTSKVVGIPKTADGYVCEDINYALVEEKRPPIYTAMKYWGKKPHNIWGKYIENYAAPNDFILDPFAGSAMSAFEAVKHGRKAIAFDINPLTSFLVEVFATKFDNKAFSTYLKEIVSHIETDEMYKHFFLTKCDKCGKTGAVVQHSKWDNFQIYEVGIICPNCKTRYISTPTAKQIRVADEMKEIDIKTWIPPDVFYSSPSFTKSFEKNIGGNHFSDIWTKRNLYVISQIFARIVNVSCEDIKKQLLFGFIQTIHLASKMCVPRREAANRAFSTSWGRSAYICSKRQMEMNPLLLFQNNCIGKQSVQSALEGAYTYLGKIPKIKLVTKANINCKNCDFDILYGTVDINCITDYFKAESISFIITDPPYGGLVQYMDLSQVWLVWLKKVDAKFTPNIQPEITIKGNIQDLSAYTQKFTTGIKNLYNILKAEGKIVFTFHNKDLMIWNSFLRSISVAGFRIEKVIHQQNRRTGESNVANPYGTSASDFYIRCSKSKYVKKIKTTKDAFENFIVDCAVKIIEARSEPTPYQILFNGLLSEISSAGFDLENFDDNVQSLLGKHIPDIFMIDKTDKLTGALWWLNNTRKTKMSGIPLSQRVEQTIHNLFCIHGELTFDDILAEIFINYPNGLTPDIKKIDTYIKKYGTKAGNKWVYNGR